MPSQPQRHLQRIQLLCKMFFCLSDNMLRRKSKLLQEFGSRTGVTKRIANADAVHRDGIILRENGTDGFTKSAPQPSQFCRIPLPLE